MHDIDNKNVLVDKAKEREIKEKKDWQVIISINENKS